MPLPVQLHLSGAPAVAGPAGDPRALPHVEAALQRAREHQPETFYLPEPWLVGTRVFDALQRHAEADAALQAGCGWVIRACEQHVPDEFRNSFLQRNEVNRELLALAASRGARAARR